MLEMATGKQPPTQIKRESWRILVKQRHHEPYELQNLRRMPRGCCATRPTYHTEIGAHILRGKSRKKFSTQASSGAQDS